MHFTMKSSHTVVFFVTFHAQNCKYHGFESWEAHPCGGVCVCGLYLEFVSSTNEIQLSHERVQFCALDHIACSSVTCV